MAARAAYNSYRSRSSNTTNQGRGLNATPAPITGFEDARTTYRHRRMPRRKKIRWRKFVKRARAVDLGLSAANFLVLTRQQTLNTSPNKQGYGNIHTVMGLNGDTSTQDVYQIALRVAALTSGNYYQTKFAVTGWLAETQVVNTSSSVAYLDLYYWRCHKTVPQLIGGSSGGASRLFQHGLLDLTASFPLGGSSLDPTDYGVTPYQSPQFSGYLKVYKKTRVKLSPGGVTQIETRSGRNYFRNFEVDQENAMDKCTEGIFFICYGSPTAANPTADNITLLFSTNINYTYKILQRNVLTGGTNAL